MTGLDQEIVDLARQEIQDSLERIERTVLAVESGSPPPDAVDALFRDAHSIKGTAGMVGLDLVATIAHDMEDHLEACRASGADPGELVDPLLQAVDALRDAVAEQAVASPPAPAPQSERDPEPELAAVPVPGPARAIRVSAEKVDRMLDAVGETVLHHRRLEHLAEEEHGMGERLLTELQEAVIEMRTLPLDSITAPYPRLVRDLALAAGKEVELVITGGDTQLDRVILEGISETIIHLARNCIAHGIERPEERVLQGKPRAGRLELRAAQRGSMVALELFDDGRGVSPELLARGRAAGSLTDLLCAPGLSTAGGVSEIAGRGVGLDAVKSHVERLGGSLEVHSEPGQGTTVVLLVPLTLALLRVLLCERAGQPFGLPLASVREVVTVGETTSLGGRRSISLRSASIPLADLAGILGTASAPLPEAPPAMIVGSSSRVAAVACDQVLGDQEVVMKNLGPLLADLEGYLGAAILEDGRVALVLDPSYLIKAHASAARPPAVPAPGRRVREASKILVVDDQFTVREMQRSILETAGYRVEIARDGREALGRVTADADIEMVLTDVQMPEMDGFALLRAIRAMPERASLPVAIVTSMDGQEHRRRGVEEGADAYVVKQQFDQQSLLDTVGRLVRP